MKKTKKLNFILIAALTVLLAVSVFGFTGCETVREETAPQYRFEVAAYDVIYDINSDCTMSVTEELAIHYLGRESTGFIRDIPVNGGAQVRGIDVIRLDGGVERSVYYDVNYESTSFVSVDIGDYYNKTGKTEVYRITYTYIVTNSVVNGGVLPLNPIGFGWDCTISNASVKLILPDGYKRATLYRGEQGSKNTDNFETHSENGRTVIVYFADRLDKYNGLTFDLQFEKGAIVNFKDFTPYYFALAAAIILVILIILKFFVFNKNYLTPVVNYEAPDKMDPLIMGKLIDNNVNNEDVTSLIFYWAGKGYIKLNLDDKNDPAIIRVKHTLPEQCPTYEKLMYSNLFKSGDVVKTSQLQNRFYTTVSQVTAMVNRQTKGLYENKSITLSVVFAVISGILLGFAPLVLAFLRISNRLLFALPLVAILPAFIVNGLMQTLIYNRLKLKKSQIIGYSLGIAAICILFGLIYVFFVPSSVLGIGAKIVLYIICCLIFTGSALLLTRTKQYTQKLNDIVGFKNYILLAEKDQLEMMLEEDPQFYYHILPYAQVLGVTDKWEEKFEGITMQPPQWATGNVFTTYLEFRLINNILRSSMRNISTGMVSRPSSSGTNGGHGGFGGGFGGHAGGGFGGGGGRGR